MNSPFAALGRQCLDCIIHTTKIYYLHLVFLRHFQQTHGYNANVLGHQVFLTRTLYTHKYILPILTIFLVEFIVWHEILNHWLRQVPKCILSVFVTYSLFDIIHRVKICYKQPVLIHQIWQNLDLRVIFKCDTEEHLLICHTPCLPRRRRASASLFWTRNPWQTYPNCQKTYTELDLDSSSWPQKTMDTIQLTDIWHMEHPASILVIADVSLHDMIS